MGPGDGGEEQAGEPEWQEAGKKLRRRVRLAGTPRALVTSFAWVLAGAIGLFLLLAAISWAMWRFGRAGGP